MSAIPAPHGELADVVRIPEKEPSSRRSKSRLRELAGAVERLQDQLEELDGQRKEKRKEITAKIREWNTEASKRK